MRNTLDDLERLDALLKKGIITEEEFKKEKEKILNPSSPLSHNLFGLTENVYCFLIHISVLLGFAFWMLGFLAPVVLWVLNKDNNEYVDRHGKAVVNWTLSLVVHYIILLLFILLSNVYGFFENSSHDLLQPFSLFSAILPMQVLLISSIIFTIIGAISASTGKQWRYPLTIKFIKD